MRRWIEAAFSSDGEEQFLWSKMIADATHIQEVSRR